MTVPSEVAVLQDVVSRLDRAGFAYMLTGSLAMSYYAEPRMTRDIDLVVALEPSDGPALTAHFRDAYYLPDALTELIAAERFVNLLHLESVTKVDIVVRKRTPFRQAEFERRRRVTVAGLPLWIVSREDLMLSKLEWARDSRSEVQLRDVRNLAAGGYDDDYLERWIQALGLQAVWREARHA